MANFSITARQSDIAKWYKDRAAQQANYNTWNDLVKAYTQQATSAFEESTQSAQQSASYDISQAYANYKQQQIAASLNQNISAGAKDVIGSQLSSAYDISAAQSQYNLAANLQSIYDKYYKTVSTADETLADQFGITESQIKNTSKGLQYLNKYISESNEYQQLWSEFRKRYKSDAATDEALQAALFQTTGEGAETTTGLSDLGKNVLASLIHRGATFGEDENRKSYSDIYDYLYNTNQDIYNLFAEQPGLLDKILELNTANTVQQKLDKNSISDAAWSGWFKKNFDRYNAAPIKQGEIGSKYGQSFKDNIGKLDQFKDIPNGTSFTADLQANNNVDFNGLMPYGSTSISEDTDSVEKDGRKYSGRLLSTTGLWAHEKNAVKQRIQALGGVVYSEGSTAIYYIFPDNEIKNLAMYKDYKGKLHAYSKSATNSSYRNSETDKED